MTTKPLKRPRDPIALAKLIGDIAKTLRVTPAMAAGVSNTLMSLEGMVRIVDEWEMARRSA